MYHKSNKPSDIKKSQNKFQKNFKVSVETFWRKWEEESLLKGFWNFKQPEKCQNKYYPNNLIFFQSNLPTFHVPHFSIKKQYYYIENGKHFKEKFGHFS